MMSAVGFAFSLLLQAVAFLMLGVGIATFVSLLKGCLLLRRISRAGRQDYGPVLLKSPMVPAVSTIATPPDASAESLQFVRRLLDLHFGRNEVVIVLDGPTDAEMEVWTRELKLCSSTRGVSQKLKAQPVRAVYESRDPVRVVVIDKEKGGPVDSWNVGVNASTSPVIGILDPDSEFVPDVLLRLIQPMLEAADETIAIIGGVAAPPGEEAASRLAALDSLRSWLTRGAAFTNRNMTMPFPGCALLVRRKAVIQAGGFTGGTLELFIRLHAVGVTSGKPYRVGFLPEALSYSRPVRTSRQLLNKVEGEQQEILKAFRNRVSISGPFGWQVLRGMYYDRVLRPILEMSLFGLTFIGLLLGWVDVYLALLVILATVGVGILISMAAVVLREFAEPTSPDERRMAAMFFAAISENLLYRQQRNLWLLAGLRKSAPPEMENRGSVAPSPPPAVSAASSKE